MAINTEPVWQRGPIDGVPGLLQPVAHALLQALEDAEKEASPFPPALLGRNPVAWHPWVFTLNT